MDLLCSIYYIGAECYVKLRDHTSFLCERACASKEQKPKPLIMILRKLNYLGIKKS
jgi:hypothetical protein